MSLATIASFPRYPRAPGDRCATGRHQRHTSYEQAKRLQEWHLDTPRNPRGTLARAWKPIKNSMGDFWKWAGASPDPWGHRSKTQWAISGNGPGCFPIRPHDFPIMCEVSRSDGLWTWQAPSLAYCIYKLALMLLPMSAVNKAIACLDTKAAPMAIAALDCPANQHITQASLR